MHSPRLCTLPEKRLLCAITAAPSLRGWGISHHPAQAADSLPGSASHSLVTSRRVPSLAAVRSQSMPRTCPGESCGLPATKPPLTSFGRLPEYLRFVIMVLRSGGCGVQCALDRIALGQDDRSRGIANGRVAGRWALTGGLPLACLQTTDKRCGLDRTPGFPPPSQEGKKKEKEGETIKERKKRKGEKKEKRKGRKKKKKREKERKRKRKRREAKRREKKRKR